MKEIGNRISEIRHNLNYEKNENNELINIFIDLGSLVIANFEIPSTHKEYIFDNLSINNLNTEKELGYLFLQKFNSIEGFYNLELPLRAIESFFIWNTKNEISDFDIKIINKLKFLISKLHYFSAKNYY